MFNQIKTIISFKLAKKFCAIIYILQQYVFSLVTVPRYELLDKKNLPCLHVLHFGTLKPSPVSNMSACQTELPYIKTFGLL